MIMDDDTTAGDGAEEPTPAAPAAPDDSEEV